MLNESETSFPFCGFCGKPNKPELSFCIYCGTPLEKNLIDLKEQENIQECSPSVDLKSVKIQGISQDKKETDQNRKGLDKFVEKSEEQQALKEPTSARLAESSLPAQEKKIKNIDCDNVSSNENEDFEYESLAESNKTNLKKQSGNLQKENDPIKNPDDYIPLGVLAEKLVAIPFLLFILGLAIYGIFFFK